MKNTVRILGAALMGIALILAGCLDMLNEPAGQAAGQGILRVRIGEESSARTLGPDTSGFSYALKITNDSGKVLVDEDIGGTEQSYDLGIGRYTVTATGYTGTGDAKKAVASATQTFDLSADETKTVSLILKPISGEAGNGILDYELDFGTLKIITAAGGQESQLIITPYNTLTDEGGDIDVKENTLTIPLPAWGENWKRTLELHPGQYLMAVTAYTDQFLNNQPLFVHREEVVHIYSGLTTPAKFSFDEKDVTASIRIKGQKPIIEGSAAGKYEPVEVWFRSEDDKGIKGDGYIDAAADGWWGMEIPTYGLPDGSRSSVDYRFLFKDGTKALYSPWYTIGINKFGNDQVPRRTIKVNKLTLPAAIAASAEGTVAILPADTLNGTDAIEGSPISIGVTPAANYGVYGASYGIGLSSYEISDDPEQKGGMVVYSFAMRGSDVTIEKPKYYHLGKTINVTGTNSYAYYPASISAYTTGHSDPALNNNQIGAAAAVTSTSPSTTGTWSIPVPEKYKWYTGSVYFKVTLKSRSADPAAVDSVYITGPYTISELAIDRTIDADDPADPPATPGNINWEALSTSSVKISWDAASGAKGYRISRDGTLLNSPAASLITATEYTDTGLSSGTSYLYTVLAVNNFGDENGTSFYASPKLVSPSWATASGDTTNNGLLDSVTVSWDSVSGANYYMIERDEGYGFVDVGMAYSTSYTENVSPVNATYTYRVIARSQYSSSSDSVPKEAGSIYAPYAEDISVNSFYTRTISSPGKKQYYRLSGSFAVLAYLYDMNYGESLNAKFHLYRDRHSSGYSLSALQTDIDDMYRGDYYLYSDPLILVVEAWNGSDTGSYSFMFEPWY